MCFIPHEGLFMRLSFSTLLLMASFWWICRYGGYDGEHASHILLSQRPDPKEKQVISLDQDVQVCGYIFFGGWWMKLLYMISLSLVIFLVWAIFSFSRFFRHTLWVCGTPSLGMHLFSLFF